MSLDIPSNTPALPSDVAKVIAQMLTSDPLAARCIKEYIPERKLLSLLELNLRHSYPLITSPLSPRVRPTAVIIDDETT